MRTDVASNSRVLYVDADRATAEAVRDSLEAANRSVATAADAEAGLERLAAAEPGSFDCVVSGMDPADGVEFLRAVRAEYPSVPFVLYPQAGSDTVAGEALETGVTDYVPGTNGPGHEPLLAAVRDAVEQGSTSPPSQAQEDAVEHSSTSPGSPRTPSGRPTPSGSSRCSSTCRRRSSTGRYGRPVRSSNA
ncbi:hypothetical protein BRC75_02435 [Halobacteriales archaeon QH_7_69_31]|nr:MAG: hypothetical protein BRC75_02435 [Halobacteriales archaeon QH_7_69_31]